MEQHPKIIVITPNELAVLIDISLRRVLSEQSPKSSYNDDKPLNIDEAADFLDIPKNTLYSYTSARKIPHKKMGRKIIFFKSELRAWLEEGKKKTRTQLESEGFKTKGGGSK